MDSLMEWHYSLEFRLFVCLHTTKSCKLYDRIDRHCITVRIDLYRVTFLRVPIRHGKTYSHVLSGAPSSVHEVGSCFSIAN